MRNKTGEPKRLFIIPDCHVPHQDKRAYSVMMQCLDLFQTDELILLGDYADFETVSRYIKNPKRQTLLQYELEDVNEQLDLIDSLTSAKRKTYIFGNHEKRLSSYLMSNASALWGLLRAEDALKLQERGWAHYNYGDHHRVGNLHMTHGTYSNKHVAQKMLDHYRCSVVFGHVHRREEKIAAGPAGIGTHVAWCPGWLGDPKKADYIADFASWSHGFSTAFVFPDGSFTHDIHGIEHGKTVFHGKVIRA